MQTTSHTALKNKLSTLQESYDLLVSKHQKLEFDYQYLQQQLSELKRMIYGSKSERFVCLDNGQLDLFIEQSKEAVETNTIEVKYQREKQKFNKQKPVREVLPAHLPRKEQIIEPEQIPVGATKIGEEITEVLEYNPSSIFVRRIVRKICYN